MSGNFDAELWANIKNEATPRTNNYRGLKDTTTNKYGVLQSFKQDGSVEKQYYPLTDDGVLVRS